MPNSFKWRCEDKVYKKIKLITSGNKKSAINKFINI